jgi:hypothetical protein
MDNIQATWEKKREGVWKGCVRILETDSEKEDTDTTIVKEESRCSIS